MNFLGAVGLFLGAHIAHASVPSAPMSIDLKRPVRYFSLTSDYDDIYRACRAFKIPCGIVKLPGDTPAEPHKQIVELRDTDMERVFEAILRDRPDERWSVEQGVVVVRPKKGGDSACLARRIRRFRAKKATIRSLERSIARETTFKTRAGGVVRGMSISDSEHEKESEKRTVDLDVEDVTVESLLDAAVRQHGSAMWSVQCRSSKKNTMLQMDVY